MTRNTFAAEAEIIPFPVGGRAALQSRRSEAKTTSDYPVSDYAMRRVASANAGAWYHEQAIQDAERGRNS